MQNKGMNTLPDLYPRQLHLMLVPLPLRRQIANAAIARLALRGPVRVLDGGNHFDAHGIARALRSKTHHLQPALQRIQVARAFTCYQVITLLQETPSSATPTLVLDLLTTFYDENVPMPERLRLLQECLEQLQRLSRLATVVITVVPQPKAEADELIDRLEASAGQTWRFELEQPKPPLRLFEMV
jgi:hypothetical protein